MNGSETTINRLFPQPASGENQTEDSGPNGRNLRSTVDPVGSIRLILSTSCNRSRVDRTLGAGPGASGFIAIDTERTRKWRAMAPPNWMNLGSIRDNGDDLSLADPPRPACYSGCTFLAHLGHLNRRGGDLRCVGCRAGGGPRGPEPVRKTSSSDVATGWDAWRHRGAGHAGGLSHSTPSLDR